MIKQNNKSTFWIVLITILGTLIVVGLTFGIYYYFNKSNKSSTTTITTTPTAQVAEVYDLDSYTNNRYGFSFKYPKTFTETEAENDDGTTLNYKDPEIIIRVYGSSDALAKNAVEYLDSTNKYLDQEYKNVKETLTGDLMLDDVAALERKWQFTDQNNVVMIQHQVTTKKDDVFYTLSMIVPEADYDEFAAHVFDNIINSFKFGK